MLLGQHDGAVAALGVSPGGALVASGGTDAGFGGERKIGQQHEKDAWSDEAKCNR